MVSWYVDEGLKALDAEWKKIHPDAVVYHIGDTNHSQNPDVSQHAPDDGSSGKPGDDKGEVDASDFMSGHGVTDQDLDDLFDGLRVSRDSRILYLIRRDKIVSSVVQPWVVRPYGGTYHTHLHVSVNDNFDKNTDDWKWEPVAEKEWPMTAMTAAKLPTVIKFGQEDAEFSGYNIIHRVQAVANWLEQSLPPLDLDGVYGAKSKQKFAKMGLGNGAQLTANQIAGILGITGY